MPKSIRVKLSPIPMIRRLVLDLVASLGLFACVTGCRRPDTHSTAASSASQPASGAAPVDSIVASHGNERLAIARFLGEGCALDQARLAWCWSPPTNKLGSDEGSAVPDRVPELDGASSFHKSAHFSYILRDGSVYVWSTEPHPYLGDVSKPKLMPAPKEVTSLSVCADPSAALQQNAEVWEWGDWSISPEAGEPGVVKSSRPSLLAAGVRALAPPSCDYFVGVDGKIYHRIFHGKEALRTQVTGLKDPLSVTVCAALSCALMNPKHVECWEERSASQTFELKAPSDVVSLKCAGAGDIYALLADGSVWVAQHSFDRPHALQRIPTLDHVAELGLGAGSLAYPHCVKLEGGSVSCWGEGDSRLLGSGTWPTDPHFTPFLKARDVTTRRSR
jgi:hypothetical protein